MTVFRSPEVHGLTKLQATVNTSDGKGRIEPFVFFTLEITNELGDTDNIRFFSWSIPPAKFEAIASAINAAFVEG